MRHLRMVGIFLLMLMVASAALQAGVMEEKKKVDDYLAAELAKEGAEKSSTGMIFRTLKPGEGASPEATDIVVVHYTGTFVDGKVFDSSVERNKPAEFPLNAVIACWTEGLQKMKLKEKAKLICPPRIAYGEKGRPPVIPPNSTLVFEVELLDIKKAK